MCMETCPCHPLLKGMRLPFPACIWRLLFCFTGFLLAHVQSEAFEADCLIFGVNYGVLSLLEQPSGSYLFKFPPIVVSCLQMCFKQHVLPNS